jgi:CRISPR/Cas system-associated endoribonuclease Cas2
MWKYIVTIATICSPILGSLHAVFFEEWRNWVLTKWGVKPLLAGIFASFGLSTIGIALVCLLGWLVWCLWSWHTHRIVRKFYWNHLEGLIEFLRTFRDEVNSEITLFHRLCKLRQYPAERWDKLKSSYDIHLKENNLLKLDRRIERYLKRDTNLIVVKELREPAVKGLKRLAELLGASQKDVITISRAEEMTTDIGDRHLDQLRRSLAEL